MFFLVRVVNRIHIVTLYVDKNQSIYVLYGQNLKKQTPNFFNPGGASPRGAPVLDLPLGFKFVQLGALPFSKGI